MLRAVARQLASLPFAFATPAGASFARDLTTGRDIPYQALVLILDALSGRGRHDLPAAFARILGNPHTVLSAESRIVPLPLADRFGPTSLLDALAGVDVSPVLPPGHSMAGSPAAVAFQGRVPERLTVERVRPDADNPENRFVAGVLEECVRAVDVVLAYAWGSTATGAIALTKECVVAHETLRLWRSHRVLDDLRPRGPTPLNSTVLQRQPGYRDVLSFWMDLIGRTRWLPSTQILTLLALRDAPTLYEYWCYFEVVSAVAATEGLPVKVDRPALDEGSARLGWSSRAEPRTRWLHPAANLPNPPAFRLGSASRFRRSRSRSGESESTAPGASRCPRPGGSGACPHRWGRRRPGAFLDPSARWPA